MRAGETLSLEGISSGCRAYLAVAGGIEVGAVLGSRATYVPAGFGGFGLFFTITPFFCLIQAAHSGTTNRQRAFDDQRW